jgi:lipopolysaccharide/colanic/teichoic acid biosynthesis glycosyltransferase
LRAKPNRGSIESTTIDDRKSITIETKQNTKTAIGKWLDDALRCLLDVVEVDVGLLLLSPAIVLIVLAI